MWATLRKFCVHRQEIVALFKARFDPDPAIPQEERAKRETEIAAAIETALQAVESLDEDRILRHFVNAVGAAIRTNFYQIGDDGFGKDLIAVKFSSRKVDGMPLPRPLYEIFVYSPRLEAVHCVSARWRAAASAGPIGRRISAPKFWLVKAQNVKNAVIVPVGAKGGFIPKYLPAGGPREAIQAEGVATYKLFISTLLDITDNIGPGTKGVIRPPASCATMATIPISWSPPIRARRRFPISPTSWRSATISGRRRLRGVGGWAGGDRDKKTGITARGAWDWRSADFREWMSISPDAVHRSRRGRYVRRRVRQWLLREKTTKLTAAFDHRDILIDPNPDPERSSPSASACSICRAELARLRQGDHLRRRGVDRRSAKEISPRAGRRRNCSVSVRSVTLQHPIRRDPPSEGGPIFFGGIGTYVRADRRNRRRRRHAPMIHPRHRQGPAPQGDRRGANAGMTERGGSRRRWAGSGSNRRIEQFRGRQPSAWRSYQDRRRASPLRGRPFDARRRATGSARMTDEVRGHRRRRNHRSLGAVVVAAARDGGISVPAAGSRSRRWRRAACSIAASNICQTT